MRSVVQRTFRGYQTKGKYTTDTPVLPTLPNLRVRMTMERRTVIIHHPLPGSHSLAALCPGSCFAATSVVWVTHRGDSKKILSRQSCIPNRVLLIRTHRYTRLYSYCFSLAVTVLNTIIYAPQLPLHLQYAQGAEKSPIAGVDDFQKLNLD